MSRGVASTTNPKAPPALAAIGHKIREQRKALKLNATSTAEAAGISRVTLYRIECGEASVSMGSYLNAIAALGMTIEIAIPDGADQKKMEASKENLPDTIRISDYPQLRQLSWHIAGVGELAPEDALNIYERNWRHVDQQIMDEHEWALVTHLVERYGHGTLLV
jgi:transcriptional regulator with XRE-family HTH domain